MDEINPFSWISKREKRKNETTKKARQKNIVSIPLLSILPVAFSVPCLIVLIICGDSEFIPHGGRQGGTHATPGRLFTPFAGAKYCAARACALLCCYAV